jgi:hypothetical protein
MSDARHLGAVMLGAALSSISAAEGNVAVPTSTITATVGTDAVASAMVTVRNTGSGPLTLRLRDAGSGTAGSPGTPAILGSYIPALGNSGSLRFDGVNLWQFRSSDKTMVISRLETGAIVRTIPLSTAKSPYAIYATDGTTLWTKELSPPSPTRPILVYALLTGTQTATINLPDRTTTSQSFSPAMAYDAVTNRVYGGDALLAFSFVPGQTSHRLEPHLKRSYGRYGMDIYDGTIWAADIDTTKRNRIWRFDLATGAAKDPLDLPAASITDSVGGVAADGWGRIIVHGSPAKSKWFMYHYDTGLRGWMTCPQATPAATTIPAGGERQFAVRLSASTAGLGTHHSFVYVDSDDADTPRITIPVTFTVEDRAADAPVVRNDAYDTTWDAAFAVTAGLGVLNNDSGAGLAASLVSGPGHGTLVFNPDGSFSYNATDGFVGSDSFTYRVSDAQGRNSAVATVSLAVDHAPIPEIQVTPAAITVTAASATATTSVDVTIANIGHGTLFASLVESGTGGSPGTVARESRFPTTAFQQAARMTRAGDTLWVNDGSLQIDGKYTTYDLRQVSISTGQIIKTITVTIPPFTTTNTYAFQYFTSIEWDGSRLWLAESNETDVDAAGNTYTTRDPKVFIVDPDDGAVLHTLSFPKPPTGKGWGAYLTADDTGGMWLHAYTSYRIDTATLAVSAKPNIVAYMTDTAWYNGLIWLKDREKITCYNPHTGAQVAANTFIWPMGDDLKLHAGLAAAGFGRFWITGGPETEPHFNLVDSGIRGWLQASAVTTAVARQSANMIRLDFHASLAGPGTHTCTVQVQSNDATDPTVLLPITFIVPDAGGNKEPTITSAASAGSTVVTLP